MPVKIPFDAPPSAQIAAARSQGVMPPDAFYRLPAEKRAQAFTISGLARLDQVQRVADEFARMQAEGGTLADFQKWAKTQDWNLPRHRLETVYRNAVQTAYNAGHWRRFEETKADRPYLMYDAINDSRVRPSHLALDGVIKPVDDPFWNTHSPQLGHRCRCNLRSLSADEAREKGGITQNPPAEGVADAGWGAKPEAYGKRLGDLVRERLAVCGTGTFARKIRGAQMQCSPEEMQRTMRLLAAEYAARAMPLSKAVSADLIIDPRGHSQNALFELARDRFSRNRAAWMGAVGYQLDMDRGLFLKQDGGWKIGKNERSRYMILMADTLEDPASVQWIERDGGMDELAVLGSFRVRNRDVFIKLAYRWTGAAWEGWSAFQVLQKNWAGFVDEGIPVWRRKS